MNNADCGYLTGGELLGNHPKLQELIDPKLSDGREEIDMSALLRLLSNKQASKRNAFKIVFRGVLFESGYELKEQRHPAVDDESDEDSEYETGLEKWISN